MKHPTRNVDDDDGLEAAPPETPPQQSTVGPVAERKPPENSGKFRLLAPHVIDGAVYETGTEVGNDTEIPYSAEPSTQMLGLDDASKDRINKRHQFLYGRDAPWHDLDHPMGERQDREARAAEEQRKEEEGAEPVSHQQAFERGKEDYRGRKVTGPQVPPTVVLNKGGDTSLAMGPAVPKQEVGPDTRTSQPLKDQLPQ